MDRREDPEAVEREGVVEGVVHTCRHRQALLLSSPLRLSAAHFGRGLQHEIGGEGAAAGQQRSLESDCTPASLIA